MQDRAGGIFCCRGVGASPRLSPLSAGECHVFLHAVGTEEQFRIDLHHNNGQCGPRKRGGGVTANHNETPPHSPVLRWTTCLPRCPKFRWEENYAPPPPPLLRLIMKKTQCLIKAQLTLSVLPIRPPHSLACAYRGGASSSLALSLLHLYVRECVSFPPGSRITLVSSLRPSPVTAGPSASPSPSFYNFSTGGSGDAAAAAAGARKHTITVSNCQLSGG